MILVNVLLIVALAASILAIMVADDDESFSRSLRLREAAQAMAIARGGELSAIVALRRDAAGETETDNLSEAWAGIGDRAARIDHGTFDLVVADAQSRFNVNALAGGDVQSRDTFTQIVASLRLNGTIANRVPAFVAQHGPLRDLASLHQAGISDAELARLATLVTVSPGSRTVNVNTAPEALLAILLGNAGASRALLARRERAGKLTPDDFAAVHTILPIGTGFTSDLFWVRSCVTIGTTSQQLTSLLARRMSEGTPIVSAVARWRGAAAPLQAPPLPRPPTRGG